MAQLFPQRHHSPDRWLRRLDRAADSMNPFLTVLAIGLVMLNLICVALVASRLPITRGTLSFTACLPSSASASGAAPPPTGDVKAWGY
jgi:hypothetical protein